MRLTAAAILDVQFNSFGIPVLILGTFIGIAEDIRSDI